MSRRLSSILVSFLLLLVTACSSGTPALPQSTKPTSTIPSATPITTSTTITLLPVSATHPSPGRNFLLLQSATPIPAACPVNPVYAGPLGKPGLDDVPWIKADPSSSQVTAFLFLWSQPILTRISINPYIPEGVIPTAEVRRSSGFWTLLTLLGR